MTTEEVRKKYLKFFESKNHKNIGSYSLVPQNDPTTLFTSSGMQPLIPYLLGEKHPNGSRLVNSQKCIRTQDIEEVGDNRHTTYFEMLGNWSLGDYFKKEQIEFVWEFLTKELNLPKEKLYVSIFKGEGDVSKDNESFKIWSSLEVSDDHIFEYGFKKNWWSRSGTPDKMPIGEIGGVDTEIFYDFGKELNLHEKSEFKDEECHPNCDCGRFMEIGNSVFIQYKKNSEQKLEELKQKNVDFGGGLERLVAAVNNDSDIFKIDIFGVVIKKIEEISNKKYIENQKEMRIIADHMRAGVALVMHGVEPSNKLQGYVLRRLLRRAALKAMRLNPLILENINSNNLDDLIEIIFNTFDKENLVDIDLINIQKIINVEISKFVKTLNKGLKEAEKISKIDGEKAFDLYQTYGFPIELTREIFEEKGQEIDKEEFEKAFNEHKEKSKTSSAGMFKGGLADSSIETTALHTATHLLHKALHEILGEKISQKGSNITKERLRFDFSFDRKLTESEIKEIDDLINNQIDKNLKVKKEMMSLKDAQEQGAFAFFGEKYGENVSVYTIFDETTGEEFSKEVCGGPHVNSLSELKGHVKIIKQEKLGANIVRVYAILTKNDAA